MALQDRTAAIENGDGGPNTNSDMEDELILTRRLAYAASSKGELLRVIRVCGAPSVRLDEARGVSLLQGIAWFSKAPIFRPSRMNLFSM
jgi:hypothetical protein